MEIVFLLVTLAGLAAAAVWWRLSRPDSSGPATGFGSEESGDLFVLTPSGEPTPRVDRPAPSAVIARLALTVAVTTVVLVAIAAAIGLILKAQLDSYFGAGG